MADQSENLAYKLFKAGSRTEEGLKKPKKKAPAAPAPQKPSMLRGILSSL
jgi:hypothetical protein